jgi:hypothetical protein
MIFFSLRFQLTSASVLEITHHWKDEHPGLKVSQFYFRHLNGV